MNHTQHFQIYIFFYQGFLSRTLMARRTAGEGRDHLLFYSTTSTCSQTFRHLFATLHVKWLSNNFNRIACIFQTATWRDLPPYQTIIWLIDYVALIFVWLLDGLILAFLLQQFETGNHWTQTSTITFVLQANLLWRPSRQLVCSIERVGGKRQAIHAETSLEKLIKLP